MTGYLQAVMLTKVAYMYVLACSNSDVIKFEKMTGNPYAVELYIQTQAVHQCSP